MTTVEQPPAEIDGDKLMAFVFRAVDEVGATLNTAMVAIGDRLGLYRAMAGAGPLSSSQLAERTSTNERYVREWLNQQAASSYVVYDPSASTYTLPPEHAVALTDADSPAFLPGFFQIALGSLQATETIATRFRSGAGFGWHEHSRDVHEGCARFFEPGYKANLVGSWLPALDGVVPQLQAGAVVADIGCGQGTSTVIMAKAFPNSTFVGSDSHAESIEAATNRAADAGVTNITFTVEPAKGLAGDGFDLVTTFDCLHDMGDPAGAAAHVLSMLKPEGTWMIVEPAAGDSVQENLNPVGRAYYGFSTLLCTPCSLSQEVALALGAQAGEQRIREIVTGAGFSRFRRSSETPFNLVFEARP